MGHHARLGDGCGGDGVVDNSDNQERTFPIANRVSGFGTNTKKVVPPLTVPVNVDAWLVDLAAEVE